MGPGKTTKKGDTVYRHVNIEIPDRQPNEDPITENQIRYIQNLAGDLKIKGGLDSLGKWQASSIIEQVKEQRDQLRYDVASGSVRRRFTLRKLFWIAVILIVLYYVIKHYIG